MTDRIRSALLELGDVPPPPDLAGAALARARRDRRRRLTGVIAGVAVLAAAAVTVPALALGRTPAEPAATQSHLIVAGYSVTGAGGVSVTVGGRIDRVDPKTGRVDPSSAYRVYDPGSRRYVVPPWDTAIVSPDGRLVAVSVLDGLGAVEVGVVPVARILDRDAVRWVADDSPDAPLPDGIGPGVWSPDSGRLYLGAKEQGRFEPGDDVPFTVRGLVVDVRTWDSRPIALTRPHQPGSTHGSLFFGPRGEGYAVSSYEVPPSGAPSPADPGLALFDERGRLTATSPAGGHQVPDQPFSPDGRFIVVNTSGPQSGYTRVLRVADGVEVARSEGGAAGWADDAHYLVRYGATVRVVELASGRVTSTAELPAGDGMFGLWIARVEGPVPPGAVVL